MSDYALHELKTWPIPFAEVWSGNKLHEIRKADRPFKRGDSLLLKEWSPETKEYSGRWILARVTYLTEAGAWGLPPDSCVMSIVVEGKNLNATGPHPPPGGVPAARPEGGPGAAAVFTDWEKVARAMSVRRPIHAREWDDLIAQHTHPAPEGLAWRMREALRDLWYGTANRDGFSFSVAVTVDDATSAAVAALDRAAAENVALRAFAESFALTAEAAVEAHDSRGRGGQQVGFHGDFAHIPPSAVNRLRWWASRAREALRGVGSGGVSRDAQEWVDLGIADGLAQAADLADSYGAPELAARIRALMPAGVTVHTCSPTGDEP